MVYVVFAVIALSIWIIGLIDASRRSAEAFESVGRTKGSTIALMVVTGTVGAAYYLLVIRRELRTGAAAHDAAPGMTADPVA